MKHERVTQFVDGLAEEIAAVPAGFFSTFRYTTTGNNLTHPVTLGFIARVVREMPGVVFVGIDVRLNEGEGAKFQPDVVGFDQDLRPLLLVDYESPNSSDARVPDKDWKPYRRWRDASNETAPYFVVTTLPDNKSPDWELRWTASGKWNEAFRGRRAEVRSNPFKFWYGFYELESSGCDLRDLQMLNINGGFVKTVQIAQED